MWRSDKVDRFLMTAATSQKKSRVELWLAWIESDARFRGDAQMWLARASVCECKWTWRQSFREFLVGCCDKLAYLSLHPRDSCIPVTFAKAATDKQCLELSRRRLCIWNMQLEARASYRLVHISSRAFVERKLIVDVAARCCASLNSHSIAHEAAVIN